MRALIASKWPSICASSVDSNCRAYNHHDAATISAIAPRAPKTHRRNPFRRGATGADTFGEESNSPSVDEEIMGSSVISVVCGMSFPSKEIWKVLFSDTHRTGKSYLRHVERIQALDMVFASRGERFL